MIRFIDIQTGNVFDGSKPYTHWFDGKQSTGLIYDKQFVVLTDKNYIDVKIESEVFYLINNHKIGFWTDENGKAINKKVYNKDFLDLSTLKTTHIHHPFHEGAQIGEYYLYTFNIIAEGKFTGTVIDNFYIDGEEFSIGANFFEENEILKINLSNFGAEINNDVRKAIYENDIDEQKNDYVLLNRKFKELLNEYINILGNKGSYKSLLNALNWFEYGNLVKMFEYWRNYEPGKEYFFQKELTQFVSGKSNELLTKNNKTTYIGISAALNAILKENGEIIYEKKYTYNPNDQIQLLNEPNPALKDVTMMWSKEVMSLKMTLLGIFFAKYFLPIHLDLIHSTVEKIIYTDTIKLIGCQSLNRFDYVDKVNIFDCVVKKENYLTNVSTFTNNTTLFGYVNKQNLNSEDEDVAILGVDKVFSPNDLSNNDIVKSYALQKFTGIGAIIPFDCYFKTEKSNIITDAKIVLYKNEEFYLSKEESGLNITSTKNEIHLHFDILITEIGLYKTQLEFRKNDGTFYTKTIEFSVFDNSSIEIKMFKLKPKDNIENIRINNWISESDNNNVIELKNVADYVLNPTNANTEDIVYMQFISATKENIANTVHTNQVIIIETPLTGYDKLSEIKFNDQNGNEIIFENVLNTIYNGKSSVYMQDVIWAIMDRSNNFLENNILDDDILLELNAPDKRYYIGVNTTFNINDANLSKYKIVSKPKDTKVWVRDMFVPYFYKLEEFGVTSYAESVLQNMSKSDLFKLRNSAETYKLKQTDVVCFLPTLKYFKTPYDFMWSFKNITTNSIISPKAFNIGEKSSVNILQPLFGRYDFRILPEPGYYDITINYRLSEEAPNKTKTVKSQFIIEKS